MSQRIIIADAMGLSALQDLVEPDDWIDLFGLVTECLQIGTLRAPREVFNELQIIERQSSMAAWATGLGKTRDAWVPDVVHQRKVMLLASQIGFTSGFETLDGKDPVCSDVARLCCHVEAAGLKFSVLSTDLGESPLSPTMEQLCREAGWDVIGPEEAADYLDLLEYGE